MAKIIPFNNPRKLQPRQQQEDNSFIPSEPINKNGSLLEDPKYQEAFKALLEKAKKLDW
ncbi:hypothetical protein H0A36_29810 [Endozoicomonas sp. SM1973]|uniref:Uncharacterized protein n=1 Tax=Spartinivicinus marinus TaxID=2994442 RepID=A0A853I8I9_9GAMM|nr:hypothetical protein [Spartinivicinus marinus]MCX4025126.1 hypothetical protein [Spartinivicinus marinus]MCX4026970.1 hypothetical protein [Spartinivicinus marinus]MCX4027916.1 hypothetical protein [Spartinivicinus marinus]NYZ70210.1 hypothetical protein [Spartinivicinus marinus]